MDESISRFNMNESDENYCLNNIDKIKSKDNFQIEYYDFEDYRLYKNSQLLSLTHIGNEMKWVLQTFSKNPEDDYIHCYTEEIVNTGFPGNINNLVKFDSIKNEPHNNLKRFYDIVISRIVFEDFYIEFYGHDFDICADKIIGYNFNKCGDKKYYEKIYGNIPILFLFFDDYDSPRLINIKKVIPNYGCLPEFKKSELKNIQKIIDLAWYVKPSDEEIYINNLTDEIKEKYNLYGKWILAKKINDDKYHIIIFNDIHSMRYKLEIEQFKNYYWTYIYKKEIEDLYEV